MTEIELKKDIARIKKIVHDYIDGVLSGEILACRWVRLCVQRHLDDLEKGSSRGLVFREDKAYHAVKFFSFLKLWKGKEYKGKEFILAPHRVFITWVLMGWYRTDGTRRFRKAYDEEARKSSKTTYLGGLAAYFFIADGESAAEIYCAAVKRDQAKLVWDNIKNLTKNTGFAKNITYLSHTLSVEATNSKCEPLSSDAKSLDGLDTHFASLDELHAHPTREVFDLIDDSVGARNNPLIFVITTAGFNQTGICYEMREYLTQILKGTIQDDSFFGIIFTLDTKKDWPDLKEKKESLGSGETYEDDWTNEDVWVKAAPALIGITQNGKRYGLDEKGNPIPGYMTKLEDMRDKCRIAQQMPSAQNNFLTKRLNIWTQTENRWIDLALWDLNNIRPVTEDSCRGRNCVGGIDLSAVSDLTVWGMLFPDADDRELIDILFRVWCPEARLFDTRNKYRTQYQSWKNQGYLITTPGDAIDYEFVRSQIVADSKIFNIQSISVDRGFQGYEFSQKLDQELGGTENDPKVIACGMGWVSMNGPCQELERRLLLKKLNHGGNPIARFAADNVAVKVNPTGGGKSPNKAALAINTPIPSPYGWISIGEVSAGDVLFDEKGDTCRVINTTDIFFDRKCFRVEFSDGTNIVADAGHLWSTWDINTTKSYNYANPGACNYPDNWSTWEPNVGGRSPAYVRGDRTRMRTLREQGATSAQIGDIFGRSADAIQQQWNLTEPAERKSFTRTTEEIASTLTIRGRRNHCIPAAAPIALPDSDNLPISPYVFGYLLGDGDTCGKGRVACDPQDRAELIKLFCDEGYDARESVDVGHFNVRGISPSWRSLGLDKGKYIPLEYMRSSIAQRIAIAQGLVDSDGYIDGHGSYRFSNTNKLLVDGFCEIVSSLGCVPRVHHRTGRIRAGAKNAESWEVIVSTNVPLARLARKIKKAKMKWNREQVTRYIIAITPITSVPVKCISVDSPSNLFLAGKSMIATHNSSQGKIDPIIVILLGLDRILRNPEPSKSAYEGKTLEEMRAMTIF